MTALLTLQEAKAALNITTDAQDEEVLDYLDAVTDMIEANIGPVTPREVTELTPAGTPMLNTLPVLSLLSVIRDGSTVPLDLAAVSVGPASGVLTVPGQGAAERYLVTYTAGRADTPPRILQAARVLLQHLWATQRSTGGGRTRGSSPEDAAGNYSMPHRVTELLAFDLKLPGIG